MMKALALAGLFLAACSGESAGGDKAAGTHSDPVDHCERLADVCRLSKSQLGVCTRTQTKCDAGVCYVCAPQH